MNDVLDLLDQAMFLTERTTGATYLLQCAWVYDRAIDIEGLRQFHHQLQRGRLGRLIERSPLPFGRHRWVRANDQPDLEIVAAARPREEFDDWLAEQADVPIHAEHGPGWHLAVLPFVDGGAGISLITSHCLTDGVGLIEVLVDAAAGRRDSVDWPAAASRRRWRALCADARRTVRDLPAIARAIVALARFAWRNGQGAGSETRPRTLSIDSDDRVTVPTATVFVGADEWDARAHSLGGTSNGLLAGLAAHFAQHLGRVAADGSVVLRMPVNVRVAADTRANGFVNVDFAVDPAPTTTDLRQIRATTRQALIRHQEAANARWALLPLIPLLPQRLVRRMCGVAAGEPTTVIASNLGAIDVAATRADGTAADCFAMKVRYPGIPRAVMSGVGGRLQFFSGRANGRVFISVLSYELSRPNSTDEIQRALCKALADFSLHGSTVFESAEQDHAA